MHDPSSPSRQRSIARPCESVKLAAASLRLDQLGVIEAVERPVRRDAPAELARLAPGVGVDDLLLGVRYTHEELLDHVFAFANAAFNSASRASKPATLPDSFSQF